MKELSQADKAIMWSRGKPLTAEELEAAHLGEDLVRISVGLEDVNDIIADLDQALARI